MNHTEKPTASQLRKDIAPAASPLGTDDEAGGVTPSGDRVEMARKAEQKIVDASKRTVTSKTLMRSEDQARATAKRST